MVQEQRTGNLVLDNTGGKFTVRQFIPNGIYKREWMQRQNNRDS